MEITRRSIMLKIVCLLVLMLLLFVSIGCASKEEEQNILDLIFDNTKYITFTSAKNGLQYNSAISGKDIDILRQEFGTIKIIKKYESDMAPFGGFEYGYRALFVVKNDEETYKVILYSLKEQMIIVREKDIYPQKDLKPEKTDVGYNISVYKCKINKKAVDIMKSYEKKVPQNGEFFTTFHPDDLKEIKP